MEIYELHAHDKDTKHVNTSNNLINRLIEYNYICQCRVKPMLDTQQAFNQKHNYIICNSCWYVHVRFTVRDMFGSTRM